MKRIRLLQGANIGLSIAVFLGIVVAVALIAQGHPYRFDLTRTGKHSLSPQTVKIIQSLKGPVEIKAFYQEAQEGKKQTEDLLDSYAYHSKKVTWSFIDPDRQPALARQYDVKTYGTLVLEGFGKKETVTLPDEQGITRAIIRLTSDTKKRIYFLTGHGERDIDNTEKAGFSSLKSTLEKANYEVEKFSLMRKAAPSDATTIVIADPQTNLLPEEITALKTYVDKGGHVLVLLSPFHDGGLDDFLKTYGYELRKDIIIDRVSRLFGGDYLIPIVNTYGKHEITESFNLASFFPLARSVGQEKQLPEGVDIDSLATTSQESWGETNQQALNQGSAEFNEMEDEKGPLTIAAIASIPVKEEKKASPEAKDGDKKEETTDAKASAAPPDEKKDVDKKDKSDTGSVNKEPAQLAVIGSADFVSNAYLGASGNSDFILNTFAFLCKDEAQIAIRAKSGEMQPLMLSMAQNKLLFWISLVLMPLLTLVAGITVYRVRRKNR